MKPEWQEAIAGWVSDNFVWIILMILFVFGAAIPIALSVAE